MKVIKNSELLSMSAEELNRFQGKNVIIENKNGNCINGRINQILVTYITELPSHIEVEGVLINISEILTIKYD